MRRFLFLVSGIFALTAGSCAAWYYSRSESPVEAYQRTQRAWVAGDHGAVWDQLDAEARRQVDAGYPLFEDAVGVVVKAIRSDPTRWVEFMMRFELGLERPEGKRARNSALTIAFSYSAGGMIPLAPYFFVRNMHTALFTSVGVTMAALLLFGYVKGRFTTTRPGRSALQTALVGGLAAAAAFGIAKAIG